MNDYKELVEELRDKYNEDRCKRLTLEAADAIEDLQHRLSLAEQAGEWEQVGDNTYKCTNCGEISCCKGKYCPDCGAKMKVQE